MRIIAGEGRGRPLRAPGGRGTRPTSDRVREAIFDMLEARGCFDADADGSDTGEAGPAVIDLFAGSGALGIEALSRGASHAVFVDSDPSAVAAITDNLQTTGFADAAQQKRARVVRADVALWVAGAGADDVARADIVFADPPYAFDGWQELLGGLATAAFAGLMVIEAGTEVDAPESWLAVKTRAYGTSVVQLVRPALVAGVPIEPKGGV